MNNMTTWADTHLPFDTVSDDLSIIHRCYIANEVEGVVCGDELDDGTGECEPVDECACLHCRHRACRANKHA